MGRTLRRPEHIERANTSHHMEVDIFNIGGMAALSVAPAVRSALRRHRSRPRNGRSSSLGSSELGVDPLSRPADEHGGVGRPETFEQELVRSFFKAHGEAGMTFGSLPSGYNPAGAERDAALPGLEGKALRRPGPGSGLRCWGGEHDLGSAVRSTSWKRWRCSSY